MVDALFGGITEQLPTAFVHAFLRHVVNAISLESQSIHRENVLGGIEWLMERKERLSVCPEKDSRSSKVSPRT
jgi:hypothetical protein